MLLEGKVLISMPHNGSHRYQWKLNFYDGFNPQRPEVSENIGIQGCMVSKTNCAVKFRHELNLYHPVSVWRQNAYFSSFPSPMRQAQYSCFSYLRVERRIHKSSQHTASWLRECQIKINLSLLLPAAICSNTHTLVLLTGSWHLCRLHLHSLNTCRIISTLGKLRCCWNSAE